MRSFRPRPAAVNHYIEANQYVKAIESAIAARQWTKVWGVDPGSHTNQRSKGLHRSEFDRMHKPVRPENTVNGKTVINAE